MATYLGQWNCQKKLLVALLRDINYNVTKFILEGYRHDRDHSEIIRGGWFYASCWPKQAAATKSQYYTKYNMPYLKCLCGTFTSIEHKLIHWILIKIWIPPYLPIRFWSNLLWFSYTCYFILEAYRHDRDHSEIVLLLYIYLFFVIFFVFNLSFNTYQ